DAMQFASCPGAAVLAAPMSDCFNKVKISNPPDGAVVASPVRIQATTANSSPVYAMQIYVDDVLKYHVAGSKLDTSLALSSGRHHVVVQSWDTAGGIHKSGVNVSVQSQAVIVSTPASNATVGSPFAIQASAGGHSPVHTMLVYANGALKYQTGGSSLNTTLALSELPPVWYFKAPLAYTSIVCTGLWPPALAWMANGDPTVAFDAGVLTITACDWTLTFTPLL